MRDDEIWIAVPQLPRSYVVADTLFVALSLIIIVLAIWKSDAAPASFGVFIGAAILGKYLALYPHVKITAREILDAKRRSGAAL